MLLEVDGLDDNWVSEWEGGMGDVHTDDIPPSVRTLLSTPSPSLSYQSNNTSSRRGTTTATLLWDIANYEV